MSVVANLTRLKLALFAALALALSAVVGAQTEEQKAVMAERLAPVGSVCLPEDADCGSGPAAAQVAANDTPRSGEAVYQSACLACHSTGAGGAPKLGDAAAWSDRIAKGMETLYASGVEGVPGTSMMAKGGCLNCSDEEVRLAVDYMVEQSQ